jgi:transcriptional regulator with XRE-family HTH domain
VAKDKDLKGKSLSELGDILRRTREERELSLDDVAKDTKIPRSHLLAIESGEMDRLPGRIFARFFIKEYLSYLGLSELWSQYDSFLPLDEQIEISSVLGTYTPPPKGFKATSRWWIYAVLVLLLGASGSLLYLRREHVIDIIKQPRNVVSVETGVGTDASPEDILAVINGFEDNQEQSIIVEKHDEDVSLQATLPHVEGGEAMKAQEKEKEETAKESPKILEIKASRGKCWVRVSRGDEKIYEGTLQRNETKTFETTGEPIKVRFGNVTAVDVTWMGTKAEMPRGSVVTVLYQADGKVVKAD